MGFTYVNDIFKDEHNEEIVYSEQTFINYSAKVIIIAYKLCLKRNYYIYFFALFLGDRFIANS